MNMVISEVVACIKQLSVEPSETLNTFDGSHVLVHEQSGACSTDSGYVSRCGNIECMGNCGVCEQIVCSMPQQSQDLDPSLFPNAESNGYLQSTENMDELLECQFWTGGTGSDSDVVQHRL